MDEFEGIEWTAVQAQTLPERIADAVRIAIIRGELPPGSPVRAVQLARRMRVSPGPLREALRQLAGEGFVTYHSRRGVVVRQADGDEARDVFDIMIALDALAHGLAASRITDDAIARAERLLRRLHAEADVSRWLPMLIELRVALMGACERPHLMALMRTYRSLAERHASAMYATPEGRDALLQNWRDIIDAYKTRDPARVLATMDRAVGRGQAVIGGPLRPPGFRLAADSPIFAHVSTGTRKRVPRPVRRPRANGRAASSRATARVGGRRRRAR